MLAMSELSWIGIYCVNLIFWIWLIRWGGAERLEGTFASGLLLSTFAPRWSADGIKLFAWVSLIVSTVTFIIGLFRPDFRSS
jgi:hypothetical protein